MVTSSPGSIESKTKYADVSEEIFESNHKKLEGKIEELISAHKTLTEQLKKTDLKLEKALTEAKM